MGLGISLAEHGLLPDALIRLGIRRLHRKRKQKESLAGIPAQNRAKRTLIEHMKRSPIALNTQEANDQHYELPPAFFQLVMGQHLKYSCCLFETGRETLDRAEAAMLALTCARAQLANGQEILDLGCGWGSLALWMADHFPEARITAVSNSGLQRQFIQEQCRKRGLKNVNALTADMNSFEAPHGYDRVVSVEMFEHLRDYRTMLHRISGWLKPGGKVFIHVFSHREFAYLFESTGKNDWMGRHFFSGGLMPSDDLFFFFQDHLGVEEHWVVDGRHYERTANAWLSNLDRHRADILPILETHYGPDGKNRWFRRWRIFFMACAELFGFNRGQEWGVSHYRFALKNPIEGSPKEAG